VTARLYWPAETVKKLPAALKNVWEENRM